MAHYMLLVIVSPDEKDFLQAVEDLLEPYSRWRDVPAYKDDLQDWEVSQEASRYGVRSNQLELLVSKRQEDKEDSGDVGLDKKGIYRLTKRNPLGRWDSWRIGGRWDGYLQMKLRRDDYGDNLGREHEQIQHNVCLMAQLPKFFVPNEIITPDGEWHSWGE